MRQLKITKRQIIKWKLAIKPKMKTKEDLRMKSSKKLCVISFLKQESKSTNLGTVLHKT
jgi:hypothetical protein